jgi:hypothetical protein
MSESAEPEEDPGDGLEYFVPPEEEAGTYANSFAIWDTAYDFVLDFAVIQLAQRRDPNDPNSPLVVPAKVVSRVHIPRSLIFEFVKTITARMDIHEKNWGAIEHPTFLNPEEEEEK